MSALTLEQELSEMKMTREQEASLIASTLMSIVRDRAISGLYGYICAESGSFSVPVERVFTADFSLRLKHEFSKYGANPSEDLTLYSGEGDFISQLSRLLMLCNEKSELLETYVNKANASIANLHIETDYLSGNDYIRHMRNAVLHGRFKVLPDDSKIVLLDVGIHKKKVSKITAKITITSDELAEIFRILMKDVYKQYLDDIGWEIS
ncbi:MAG: hypothetical protein RR547_04740 [Raoultibacter sp.]